VRARALVLGAAAAVLVLSGCSPDAVAPRETSIDVDTPALREQKAQIGVEACRPGPAEAGSNDLPELTLPCLGGGPDVDLSTLRGPLLINVWQSACGPCREEMPVLQQFDQRYGDQVPVLGVDTADTYPGAALGLMEATGATYPSIADPTGAIFGQPDLRLVAGYPQFLLVGADGQVSTPKPGGFTRLDQVVDYVEQGLGTRL